MHEILRAWRCSWPACGARSPCCCRQRLLRGAPVLVSNLYPSVRELMSMLCSWADVVAALEVVASPCSCFRLGQPDDMVIKPEAHTVFIMLLACLCRAFNSCPFERVRVVIIGQVRRFLPVRSQPAADRPFRVYPPGQAGAMRKRGRMQPSVDFPGQSAHVDMLARQDGHG